jgi:hypothetical protein
MSNHKNSEKISNSNWTLVKKKSSSKRKLPVKRPIAVEYKENPYFYSHLDELSLLVYYVLTKFQQPLPASAIKKEVNGMIKLYVFPPYMLLEQRKALHDEYEKKEIGWALYEGPLKDYLLHTKDTFITQQQHPNTTNTTNTTTQTKKPRLWCLNLKKINQFTNTNTTTGVGVINSINTLL